MKLELRAVSHSKALSEETPAYTATLYVDGKAAFAISNHGTGGPDHAHRLPTSPVTLEAVEAWLAANEPPLTFDDFAPGMAPTPCDLEIWCHRQLDRIETEKYVDRLLKSKVLVFYPDQKDISQFGWKGCKQVTPEHIKRLGIQGAIRPGGVVLNGLPKDHPLFRAALQTLMA